MARKTKAAELAIYVPVAGNINVATIAPGSGIVGPVKPESVTGRIVIDYEGGLYESSNIRTWADRVIQAEGRHRVQYPTVARSAVPADSVRQVGTLYDETERWVIPRLFVSDRQALAEYLGLDERSDEFNQQLLRSR